MLAFRIARDERGEAMHLNNWGGARLKTGALPRSTPIRFFETALSIWKNKNNK